MSETTESTDDRSLCAEEPEPGLSSSVPAGCGGVPNMRASSKQPAGHNDARDGQANLLLSHSPRISNDTSVFQVMQSLGSTKASHDEAAAGYPHRKIHNDICCS